MKRYIVFGNEVYYAAGGACDYLVDFSRKDHALSYAERYADYEGASRWAHVWDTKEMKILESDHEMMGYHQ